MPLTTVGWNESQDSAALVNIAALVDNQHIRTNGDDVIIPAWARKLYAAYFGGTNASLARLSAPSLRDVQTLDFEPIDIADEPTYPLPFHAFTRRGASGSDDDADWAPLTLEASEGLQVLMAETDALGQNLRALAWLGDGIVPRPNVGDGVRGGGRIVKARATGTTTLVAEAWTNVPLVFDQTLRAGWWACGGHYGRSAGAIATRLVTPGIRYRPGAIAGDTVADAGHPLFRNFGMGTQTVFYHDNPPSVDFLATSADTAEVVDLDLVYLGEAEPSDLLAAFQANAVA